MGKLQSFERQPDESDGSWAGFQVYRDMGPSRSLAAVSTKIGTPLSTLKSASATHAWRTRAQDWDRHIDRVRTNALETEEAARARMSLDTVNLLSATVVRELSKLLAEAQEMPHSVMKANTLCRAAETCVKLQRLIDGSPTERVEVGGGVDYSALSDSDLETLEKIARKAAGGGQ